MAKRNRVTKKEMVNEIVKTTGYPKSIVTLIIDNYLRSIHHHLSTGYKEVYLPGIGTFSKNDVESRQIIGFDGYPTEVPAHRRVAFSASKKLKRAL